MLRVLVALTPRMYREAIALSVHRERPGLDVRLAPPEAAEAEIASFRPHLIVHNDTAPVPKAALEAVPWRAEIVYSDGMDARFSADGAAERVEDPSTADLLRVVDRAVAAADGGGHG